MTDKKKNDLPQGWIETTLGEIVYPSRPRENPADFPDMPFIGLENIEAHTMKLLGTVPASTVKSSSVHFYPDDVLYGRMRSYLNKVYRPDFEGLCSAEFIVFNASKNHSSKWLQYLLNSSSFVSFATRLGTGDRPRVDYDQISAYTVKLAPLAEQKRIVEEIETQFSRLDKAVEGLKKTQTNLQNLRVATLKWACEGKLVPTEAELARREKREYESADALLKRILKERRTKWEADQLAKMQEQGKPPKDDKWKSKYLEPTAPDTNDLSKLPEGWTWATVDQLAEVGTGATPLRSNQNYYKTGTIPWVTSGAVNSLLIDEAEEYITELAIKETNAKVFKAGTLLIAMYGEGKTRGKVSELKIDAATNQACAALTFNETAEKCKKYAKIFFQMNYDDIRRLASGGVQPNLNLTIIKETTVPLPPLSEQERIVSEVEKRFSVLDKLESIVEKNLQRSEGLREKILQESFEGKLVEQNSNDESAENLLERIRREREEKGLVKKKPSWRGRAKSKDDQSKAKAQASSFNNIKSTQTMADKDIKPPRNIKLLSLKLDDQYRSLFDFKHTFRKETENHPNVSPICLVGLNGSGKSNLIEALSEIFCYLELINLEYKEKGRVQDNWQRNLQFEIVYALPEKSSKKNRIIKVKKEKKRTPVFIEVTDDKELRIEDPRLQLSVLPKWIIGYSSGLNETISIPFAQVQYYYSVDVRERAFGEDSASFQDSRTLFMDYDSNSIILLANYLLGSRSERELFRQALRIDDVDSFDIVFQFKPRRKRPIVLTDELKEYRNWLADCADKVDTPANNKTQKEVYSYKANKKTFDSFHKYFKTAQNLFTALYKFSLLNALALEAHEREFYLRPDIREGSLVKPPTVSKDDRVFNIEKLKLQITEPRKEIDYAGISDGEHQFIQVFGSIQLFNEPGTLFLLDEPESHFNPRWRREFVTYLDDISTANNQEFVISTHSPFIVSGCHKENVLHFEREKDRIYFRQVDFETFGSSFEDILLKLFKLESTISKQAFEEIRDAIRSQNLNKIEEAIENIGDSFEKRFLYQEAAKIRKQLEEQK